MILKILLVVLLVLFVFALAVLFVPVRYRVHAERYENTAVRGKITWLLHIICIKFVYENEQTDVVLKVFGFSLRKKRKNISKEKSSVDNEQGIKEKSSIDNESDIKEKNSDNIPDGNEDTSKGKTEKRTDKTDKKEEAQSQDRSKNNSRKKGLSENFSNFLKVVKNAGNRAALIKQFLAAEETADMICFAKKNMLHLWKHIRPRKIKSGIRFGAGEPDVTGELLGVLAVLMAGMGIMLNITPDFENTVLEGYIQIEGRITVFKLLVIIVRIYFSDEWKSFSKSINELKEEF